MGRIVLDEMNAPIKIRREVINGRREDLWRSTKREVRRRMEVGVVQGTSH